MSLEEATLLRVTKQGDLSGLSSPTTGPSGMDLQTVSLQLSGVRGPSTVNAFPIQCVCVSTNPTESLLRDPGLW